ncbi:MAG: dicarboxylate/amino acid:cation symporter [Brevundimonas aurantiaca]|uniref:dicarboxylate/amino acid:cation symporter n=1 Tax=Brevundimonas aurantiaca TaxID=74316 RepID=UPI004033EF32
MIALPSAAQPTAPRPFYRHLYFQVLTAIVAGALIGHFWPSFGESLKPLGDAFIKLVKMIIAPVIFLTIVTGIAGMSDIGRVGRVAAKAFAYFLTFSTLALIVGLIIANVVQPGHGLNIDPASLDAGAVAKYSEQAHETTVTGFLMGIIPDTFASAFSEGNILQVLFVSVLFGLALAMVGDVGKPVLNFLESVSHAFFKLVAILMKAAPIGAFGAFAFTIGKYGIGSIANLAALVATFYITAVIFVVGVLGLVAWANGFNILKLIRYLKEELLLVLGTSSSEAALPSLLNKMERAGASKSVVGLVVPTGYSFNLDGTNIYMTMAALFIAQATNVDLSLGQQLTILGVLLLTSKGAAAVTGGGFVTLAATLSTIDTLPVAGLALLLGIDRFMSEARAITNLIGNGVATIVVAKWEGALDPVRMTRVLDSETVLDADAPEILAEGVPATVQPRHYSAAE